ncbi:MAG: ribosome small subunit-dependent GTPase A [Clostridia bacterium]|nr:ribosome small subunit-dependent GTPase A [Clostridia bacterium]
MEGFIIQGVGGIYKIMTDAGVVDAIARGRLKKEGIKPVIGDKVVLEKEADSYAIVSVAERKNCLIRPAVANVDQMIVVIAAAQPDPNFKQTDKLLTMLEYAGHDVKICINKTDIENGEEFGKIYEEAGYKVVYVSGTEAKGIKALENLLKDKITAFAGCSGVGKSSLINAIDPSFSLETKSVGKIKRGTHTTTHARLLPLPFGGFIADTPGFSVVDITHIPKEELFNCFPEMRGPAEECRFPGCSHTKERECGIISALENGKISKERYESYLDFYQELAAIYKY